ncbi:MAG: glycosyltransferase [Algibacter sp.]
MKILFVSMPSIHASRWIENLKDTNHELYWFNVLDAGRLDTNIDIIQFTKWKQRKIKYIKGEYVLRKKLNIFYKRLQPFLEVTINEKLDEIVKQIQPDLVHSFEMQSCSYPILSVMNKYSRIKWLYSCWGSDLFYYRDFEKHNKKIKSVLNRIDYLHTDCLRDFSIAKILGFRGDYLGVIPGGGGYKLNKLIELKETIRNRKIILIKGYEHKFGRAINVIKAIQLLDKEIVNYEVVVFGTHQKVINYIRDKKLPYIYYGRDELNHFQVLELMGKSRLYIGNSISDGLPNTLIEAMIMGAFPIQSNPGNVSTELIKDTVNGLLINSPDNIEEIRDTIKLAFKLGDEKRFENAANINSGIANLRLDFNENKKRVKDLYHKIEIA